MRCYTVENGRTYLNLSAKLAPYKVAVFPFVKNKPAIMDKAKEVFEWLKMILIVILMTGETLVKVYVPRRNRYTILCNN